jgi:hypothetical protein
MRGLQIQSGTNRSILNFAGILPLLVLLTLVACDSSAPKSDTELGLNPQQVAGRGVYDANCGNCHAAYSSGGRNGPSLKKIFRRQYLPLSGMPANDDRVTDIIRSGRAGMPSFGQALTPEQIQNLLVYMHTL